MSPNRCLTCPSLLRASLSGICHWYFTSGYATCLARSYDDVRRVRRLAISQSRSVGVGSRLIWRPNKLFQIRCSKPSLHARESQGMALTICHSIVEAHSGHLGPESGTESGAAFCFAHPAPGECRFINPDSPIVFVVGDDYRVRAGSFRFLMQSRKPVALWNDSHHRDGL